MAIREYVDLLKHEGVGKWNDWRKHSIEFANFRLAELSDKEFSEKVLVGVNLREEGLGEADLRGADLAEEDLRGVDFRGVDLTGADLRAADLTGADLTQSNLTEANLRNAKLRMAQLTIADLTRADLNSADLILASLVKANLIRASLENAQLNRAELLQANLTEANLRKASLFRAYLIDVKLCRADLSGASLEDALLNIADFREAKLYKAELNEARLLGTRFDGVDLGHARLHYTYFNNTKLDGASFDGAHLYETIFGNVDLSLAKGLDAVEHHGPSTIGIDTLFKSGGKIPDVFLRGAGVSENLIAYVGSLVGKPVEFYSCFISYSHTDKAFARRLHDTLQGRGIRCWLDEHQMLAGDDVYDQVDRGIRLWDKVLLCCSHASLSSWWVDNEIGKAFHKEQVLMKERGKKTLALIPLDLDGELFAWKDGKADEIRRRFAPDFIDWEQSNARFEKGIDNVMKALRVDDGGREKPPKPLI